MAKKSSTEEFISKAKLVHGDRYDYSKVVYVNNSSKVIIGCPVHGDFEQKPNDHLNKHGCPNCGGTKKSSTEEFISKAKLVHGDRYDYSKVNYINAHTKVIIGCLIHEDFEQRPYSHLNGSGCIICSGKKQSSTEEFISKAKLVHGDRYDYSKVVYVNNSIKVIIGCPVHEDFEQTPNKHLNKQGCPNCGGTKKSSTEEFISKAKLVHGDRYDYSKVVYVNNSIKVIIGCKEHGDFKQTPNSHFTRNGCHKCSKSNYSKKAIIWLNQTSEKENIYIQHAENKGEYRIPGTNYKADGYCSSNNTIYEFYGDRFHGNLNLFEENYHCHPFINKSAGSLYTKTKQREQEIIDLGYNLITIWEDEWNKIWPKNHQQKNSYQKQN